MLTKMSDSTNHMPLSRSDEGAVAEMIAGEYSIPSQDEAAAMSDYINSLGGLDEASQSGGQSMPLANTLSDHTAVAATARVLGPPIKLADTKATYAGPPSSTSSDTPINTPSSVSASTTPGLSGTLIQSTNTNTGGRGHSGLNVHRPSTQSV